MQLTWHAVEWRCAWLWMARIRPPPLLCAAQVVAAGHSTFTALWCLLPFWLRRAVRSGRAPRHPAVHASPAVARIMEADTLRDALAAETWWNREGCSLRPLADLPR